MAAEQASEKSLEFPGNLDLLRSGKFSDATVSCKDRTWNVHRCILEPRSAWFVKALSGEFEEGKTKHITFEEAKPAILNFVLEYIYCGPDSNYMEKIQRDADLDVHFGTLVEIMKLLEFLQLFALQHPMLEHLVMALTSVYHDVQLHFRDNAGQFLNFQRINTIKRLCNSAPTIFTFDTSPWTFLQDSCVALFSDNFWILTMDKRLRKQLQHNCPALVFRLWDEMGFSHQLGLVLPYLPMKCVTCNNDPLSDVTLDNYFHHLSGFQLIGHSWECGTDLNVELVCNVCHRGSTTDPGYIKGQGELWQCLIPRSLKNK